MLLSSRSPELLRNQKNLLAFSAGIDSTALFFLLMEANIDFDIALINYHTRESSSKEALYARELADRYNKKCYIKEVLLEPRNFEHEARQIRYTFFEEIIRHHHYDNLLTAHHLNDRLEWFLMQLTKGAGLVEMLGFDEVEKRKGYLLIRPLIYTDKLSLKKYLDFHHIKYFIDESNFDEKYKRNYFRKHFATPLIKKYKTGIRKSFQYLQKDKEALFDIDILQQIKDMYILQSSGDLNRDIRQIDKIIKQMGYILSSAQKEEIVDKKEVVIADRFVICLQEKRIFISPFIKTVMPKPYKELCRKAKIPAKIRPYLYTIGYDFTSTELL